MWAPVYQDGAMVHDAGALALANRAYASLGWIRIGPSAARTTLVETLPIRAQLMRPRPPRLPAEIRDEKWEFCASTRMVSAMPSTPSVTSPTTTLTSGRLPSNFSSSLARS